MKSLCSLKTNHDFENLSDHLPVVLNLKNEALFTGISNTPAPAHYINSRPIVIDNCNLDWNNSNNAAYYELTRQAFFSLHKLLSESDINILHKNIPDFSTKL